MNNFTFKTRKLYILGHGMLFFASDEAIEQLYDGPEGELVSEKAREYYESIVYFLEDDELEMPNDELSLYINRYILI